MSKRVHDNFSEFRKGERVSFTHVVQTKHIETYGSYTILRDVSEKASCTARPFVAITLRNPLTGHILGISTRKSGSHLVSFNIDNNRTGKLIDQVTHQVLMVEPDYSQRWLAPLATLPEYCKHITVSQIVDTSTVKKGIFCPQCGLEIWPMAGSGCYTCPECLSLFWIMSASEGT